MDEASVSQKNDIIRSVLIVNDPTIKHPLVHV